MAEISIIIPIYNSENDLCKCLDSIIAQTFKEWECILVDDGSKDNSPKICDRYAEKDSRFCVIHKSNGGVSSARNVGLNQAKGKYIAFADSDDWVENTWLKEFVDNVHGRDLVMQNAVWHDFPHSGETFYRHVSVNDDLSYPEKIKEMYENNLLGYIWAAIFRRDIIEKYSLRFNEEYKWREDREFMLRYCLHINRVKVSSACLYHYNFPTLKTREYKKFSLFRIRLVCDEMSYVKAIVGNELSKQLELSSAVLFETYKMYLDKRICRTLRVNALADWVYKNNLCYKGNVVVLKAFAWFIKHFNPRLADILMFLTVKLSTITIKLF